MPEYEFPVSMSLPLYEKIRVKENPCCYTFNVVFHK